MTHFNNFLFNFFLIQGAFEDQGTNKTNKGS